MSVIGLVRRQAGDQMADQPGRWAAFDSDGSERVASMWVAVVCCM